MKKDWKKYWFGISSKPKHKARKVLINQPQPIAQQPQAPQQPVQFVRVKMSVGDYFAELIKLWVAAIVVVFITWIATMICAWVFVAIALASA